MSDMSLQAEQADVFGEVKRSWKWMLALGIVMVILGIVGLGMTVFLTVASVVYFGVLLLFGSGFQLADAFRSKGWKSVSLHVLMAVLYLIGGFVMIGDPVGSSVWLTLMIAAMLAAAGVMRIIMGFQMRGSKGWGWVAFSGVLSIFLGVMVFMKWPASGLWVIGLFVAIELIVQGVSSITVALAAKAVADVDDQTIHTNTPSGAAPA